MVRDGGGGGGYPKNLPSAGDHVEVDRDVLRDVAKKLQADLDGLNEWDSGSLKDLKQNDKGRVDKDALGDYKAGQDISQTFQNAYDKISATYSEFVSSYQQVINAIKQSADNYQRAEDATAASAHRARTGGQQQW